MNKTNQIIKIIKFKKKTVYVLLYSFFGRKIKNLIYKLIINL